MQTGARRKPHPLVIAGMLTLVVLFVVEVGLRVVFSIPALQPVLTANDSYSWQRLWIARRSSGNEIFYSFDVYDPTLGWATAPNIRDLPVFEGKFLNTNSAGFRGTREFSFERTPGVLRILLLGDSFTFGDEVSDHETFAHFLGELLPEAEIINMAVHGYGHDQMLLSFLEKGLAYRPDIVILGYIHADLDRNVLWFRDYAKPLFTPSGDELFLTHSPVPAPEAILRRDWARPRLLDAISIVRAGAAAKSGAADRLEKEVTHLIFDQLVEAIRSTGAVPVFVYLPFGQDLLNADARVPGEDFLLDYCAGNPDLHCFSTRPEFATRRLQGVEFQTDFHWAAPGHQAVAQSIFENLVALGLFQND